MTEASWRVIWDHLGTISGPVWRVGSRVNSESILSQFWTLSETHLRNLIEYTEKSLPLAVGRVLRLEYGKYGSWSWLGGYPGSTPSRPTHLPLPRVHPPPLLLGPASAALSVQRV